MNVEWVILADAAEVINGKLYLMGGGWEAINLATPMPAHHTFAIAVAFEVPYLETNQLHDVDIRIQDPDGIELIRIEGQVEVGRPPGINPGSPQRIPVAFSVSHEFTKAGPYAVHATADGGGVPGVGSDQRRKLVFQVTAPPPRLSIDAERQTRDTQDRRE